VDCLEKGFLFEDIKACSSDDPSPQGFVEISFIYQATRAVLIRVAVCFMALKALWFIMPFVSSVKGHGG
jgi:hypothetical protein